ncbi:hypothetical protein [Cytobacillus sp. FSL R5-0596]|uniref:hypothetical protein n=1 Tax=Cytobacillus sp. FSL R5-0596 TaxID=2954696 RepID=UPI0030F93F8A
MKKYTHVKCIQDVVEHEIVIFKSGEIYKITGLDYRSLVYYVEPEFAEDNSLPDEFVIMPLDKRFEFIVM